VQVLPGLVDVPLPTVLSRIHNIVGFDFGPHVIDDALFFIGGVEIRDFPGGQ